MLRRQPAWSKRSACDMGRADPAMEGRAVKKVKEGGIGGARGLRVSWIAHHGRNVQAAGTKKTEK